MSGSSSQQCNIFNYEVERRVQDRLADFLGVPRDINAFIANLKEKGGFKSGNLRPSDRDEYLKIIMSFPSNLVYAYMEDGFGMGYDNGFHFAYYREPINSGYSVDDPAFEPWLKSCVDAYSGEPVDCLLEAGSNYIKYFECDDADEDCDLYEPCPDDDSQNLPDCTDSEGLSNFGVSREDCLQRKKWCRKYTIETAQALPNDPLNRTGLGYASDTYFCFNERAEVTQTPGDAYAVDGSGMLGSTCVYGDGVTPVNRTLAGPYGYCGDNGEVCDGTFVGGFYVSLTLPMRTREMRVAKRS